MENKVGDTGRKGQRKMEEGKQKDLNTTLTWHRKYVTPHHVLSLVYVHMNTATIPCHTQLMVSCNS